MAQKRGKLPKKKKAPASMLRGWAAVAGAAAVLVLVIVVLAALSGQTPAPATASGLPENPFGPEDFVVADGYVTCPAGKARMGIDVSAHQGVIDWDQVADTQVEFAFIRIGYRGYSGGSIYTDEQAEANLSGAAQAGIPRGVYFYSQAISPEEAVEEARFCIESLKGHKIELPVVFDWEYVSPSARTGDMDRQTLTECTLAFCREIQEAGYEPMIYFNRSQGYDLLDLERLTDYPWWLAWYADSMDFRYRVDVWQYTENGSIPGVTGDVDIDLWFTYD